MELRRKVEARLQVLSARIITQNETKPLKDSDTVRLYHGTTVDHMMNFITKGLTGDTKIYRKYSYENNNNPRGLFVTPDLKTAKRFGAYIIEFHARVKDLEAPVWPGGVFTSQGQMAEYFKDDEHRNETMLKRRLDIKKTSQYDFIKNSDRPDVAHWLLLGGERQALFIGNLNPNSIRAVWISNKPGWHGQTYKRYSPRDVIKMYKTTGIPTSWDKPFTEKDKKDEGLDPLVKPRENISAKEFLKRLAKEYDMSEKQIMDILIKHDFNFIKDYLWNDTQRRNIDKGLRDLAKSQQR